MRELSDKCATAQVRQRHGEAQRRKAFEMLQEVRQQAERRGLKEERLREEQYVLLARLAELEQGFGPLSACTPTLTSASSSAWYYTR
eukprot:4259548-Prymnesium_polylepis.1